MKLFVSQPMRGKTKEEIAIRRQEIISEFKSKITESNTSVLYIIDSIIVDKPPETSDERVWYLGKSIELLSDADFAVFDHNWQDYSGCKIEHAICEAYDICHLDL